MEGDGPEGGDRGGSPDNVIPFRRRLRTVSGVFDEPGTPPKRISVERHDILLLLHCIAAHYEEASDVPEDSILGPEDWREVVAAWNRVADAAGLDEVLEEQGTTKGEP